MKTRQLLFAFAMAAILPAVLPCQTPTVAPDEVVVSIYGREYTAGEIEQLRRNLPQQFKASTQHMDNKAFLETFGYLQALAKLAEDDKLGEKEPYRTQLEFNNLNFMAQAYLSQINSTIKISEQEKLDYYEANKGQYREVRVAAISIDYTPIPELAEKDGKTVVEEREAWEKAERLLLELRQGADFAEMVRQHSSDTSAAAKDGDLGFFKPGDQLSQAIKDAIFKLEVGQVSAPVKDGGKFYIFKVTEERHRPLAEVATEILQKVQGEKLTQRLDEIRSQVKIEYTNPEYLTAKPGQ